MKAFRSGNPVNLLVLVCLLVSICGFAQAAERTTLGPLAEPIETLAQGPLVLSESIGKKPVYLKFWASWCLPCRDEMPHLQRTYTDLGSAIDVVSVNIFVNESAAQIASIKDKYGLTVPIALDKTGALAQYYNFMGTPFHVVLDASGRRVYQSHQADEKLDQTLRALADNPSQKLAALDDQSTRPPQDNSEAGYSGLLYLSATWCDWYLNETHPAMAKNCIQSQTVVQALVDQFPKLAFEAKVSRLWTESKDVAEYRAKYAIDYPVTIDTDNTTFLQFRVNQFPTLLLVDNGKVIFRQTDFSDPATVIATSSKQIAQWQHTKAGAVASLKASSL